MQFKLQPDEKRGTLELNGEITLLQAEEFMALLNQALEATDQIVIDAQGVTDIDMAGLQLLCAAHKSAVERNKQLAMNPNLPDALASKIDQAGLGRQPHCESLKDTTCLWMGGNQ